MKASSKTSDEYWYKRSQPAKITSLISRQSFEQVAEDNLKEKMDTEIKSRKSQVIE